MTQGTVLKLTWPCWPAMRSATATPSSSALCASIGPRTTSPMAQTPAKFVLHSPSTTTMPRSSSFRPTASGFRPMVLAVRPMETISLSTASTCSAPFASVYVTATPLPEESTFVTFTPSSIFRFCLAKTLAASLAMDSSAAPRNAGSASRIVTCAPRRRHTEPISRPTTPEPMTPSVFGTPPMRSAPSLDRILSSSNGAPGSARALEPVATITCLAISVSAAVASENPATFSS